MAHVIIGLKTTKGTKQLKLDPSIYDAIQKEKISCGDVIYIEVRRALESRAMVRRAIVNRVLTRQGKYSHGPPSAACTCHCE